MIGKIQSLGAYVLSLRCLLALQVKVLIRQQLGTGRGGEISSTSLTSAWLQHEMQTWLMAASGPAVLLSNEGMKIGWLIS